MFCYRSLWVCVVESIHLSTLTGGLVNGWTSLRTWMLATNSWISKINYVYSKHDSQMLIELPQVQVAFLVLNIGNGWKWGNPIITTNHHPIPPFPTKQMSGARVAGGMEGVAGQ